MKSLDNKNIDSADLLYLIFNNVDGYIERNSIKESNGDKKNNNNYYPTSSFT